MYQNKVNINNDYYRLETVKSTHSPWTDKTWAALNTSDTQTLHDTYTCTSSPVSHVHTHPEGTNSTCCTTGGEKKGKQGKR